MKKLNLLLSLMVSISVISCNNANLPTSVYNVVTNGNKYIIDLKYKGGAKISAGINFKSFNIKLNLVTIPTNSSGNIQGLVDNIKTIEAFLLSLDTGYTGTDPIGDGNTFSGPVTLTGTGTSFSVTFQNVPGQATGKDYYIGVRLKDSSNRDLIKVNTAWTGTTAADKQFALSSGRVHVSNTDMSVSTTAPLSVDVNLLDGAAASIGSRLNVTNGSLLASSSTDIGIKSIAGTVNASYYEKKGIAANVLNPGQLSMDSDGNIIIADTDHNTIDLYNPYSNKIKVIAGCTDICSTTPDTSGTQDASSVKLNKPQAATVDPDGNIYIADTNNNFIEKYDILTGKIKVIVGGGAGTLTTTFPVDGTTLSLSGPAGIVADNSGNIYYSDTGHNNINKLTSSGVVQFAGYGATAPEPTGTVFAYNATISSPKGLSLDKAGDLYVAEFNRIDKIIKATGKIKLFAGGGLTTVDTSGTIVATNAFLNNFLTGVFADNFGNVYVPDKSNNQVDKIDSSGKITKVAGSSTFAIADTSGTQDATSVQIQSPSGVVADLQGNVYISNSTYSQIDKLSLNGKIKQVAGGTFSSPLNTSGTQDAAEISVDESSSISGDSSGNIYFGNSFLVGKIDSNGKAKLIAGNGSSTPLADTSGTQNGTDVSVSTAGGLATDDKGNLFISDTSHKLIEKLDLASGKIKVIAGCGTSCSTLPDTTGNQDATAIKIDTPTQISYDILGNIYISENTNKQVLKLDLANSKIKVVAGCGTSGCPLPDTTGTQNATDIDINFPNGLDTDSSGNLYFSTNAGFVLKVTPSGKLKHIAGCGTGCATLPDTTGTQDPLLVHLSFPRAVVLDSVANLYISDSGNKMIEKIDKSSGKIKVVAGDNNSFLNLDVVSTPLFTSSFFPQALFLANDSRLYVLETLNIIKIEF